MDVLWIVLIVVLVLVVFGGATINSWIWLLLVVLLIVALVRLIGGRA
jgi:hypothetical protein